MERKAIMGHEQLNHIHAADGNNNKNVASQRQGVEAPTIKTIRVPNGKVGVVVGKGWTTMEYIQNQSGAKIRIIKEDPHSEVELTGTSDQISRAEELINDLVSKISRAEELINLLVSKIDARGSAAQGSSANQYGEEEYGEEEYGEEEHAEEEQPQQVAAGYGGGYYGQQQPGNVYNQTHVAGNNYNHAYGQQATNVSSQAASAAAAVYAAIQAISSLVPGHPYPQQMNTRQAYRGPPSYAGQPAANQTGYYGPPNQSGHHQTAHGASFSQPGYGQGGYSETKEATVVKIENN